MRVLKVRRNVVGVILLIIVMASLAYAVDRSSAGFNVPIDDVTGGGGMSSSSSYILTDSALGQAPSVGPGSSANFDNDAGVVQSTGLGLAVGLWLEY